MTNNEENKPVPDSLDITEETDKREDWIIVFTPEFAESLVGLTKENAVKTIKDVSPNLLCRVRSVDGKGIIGTADFRMDRANIHLVNNIVTKVTIG
jgi:hypothetical protein